MKLSELQFEKTSSYLLDISKLIFGASIVPIFVPDSQFKISYFIFGILVTGLSFVLGLTALKNKTI